ncbi:uncharacterized protein ACA1_007010 [Acanthamoeba castellanii str. Neff]|uniref:Uncharacterized protein n=1 Tax=Acanthamoeba castellanii (strain ATCC 30010 / Neff) TaxID=1257118 RepID=L8H585_ACACF|nr:uncharacterized protein ACA1_007010 [Acanthamoeba castellanii str. Neff]ELR19898.1 hypothetical protein ACA1_007010 [Acanthamoeba castellanii str. Neff]
MARNLPGTVYYNIGLVVLEDKRSYCPLCDQDCSTVQAGANHCRTHEHKTNKRLHSYHLGHYCWTGEGSTWCCACALLLTAESVEQHARDARHVTNALHFGEAADKSINSRKTKFRPGHLSPRRSDCARLGHALVLALLRSTLLLRVTTLSRIEDELSRLTPAERFYAVSEFGANSLPLLLQALQGCADAQPTQPDMVSAMNSMTLNEGLRLHIPAPTAAGDSPAGVLVFAADTSSNPQMIGVIPTISPSLSPSELRWLLDDFGFDPSSSFSGQRTEDMPAAGLSSGSGSDPSSSGQRTEDMPAAGLSSGSDPSSSGQRTEDMPAAGLGSGSGSDPSSSGQRTEAMPAAGLSSGSGSGSDPSSSGQRTEDMPAAGLGSGSSASTVCWCKRVPEKAPRSALQDPLLQKLNLVISFPRKMWALMGCPEHYHDNVKHVRDALSQHRIKLPHFPPEANTLQVARCETELRATLPLLHGHLFAETFAVLYNCARSLEVAKARYRTTPLLALGPGRLRLGSGLLASLRDEFPSAISSSSDFLQKWAAQMTHAKLPQNQSACEGWADGLWALLAKEIGVIE